MRFNFRGVYISRMCNFQFFFFFFFAFLNSRLLGTVVLKYSRVKYLWIYSSCRGAKLAGVVGFVWRCSRIERRAASEDFISTRRYGRLSLEKGLVVPAKEAREDPFAVVMKRGAETVGHVARTVSCVCTLFLRQRGSIFCEVTGSSRLSVDLSPF